MYFFCNLISQKFFYMLRAMKVHHQEVNCRTQALLYDVVSTYIWYYGESSMCIICRMEQTHSGGSFHHLVPTPSYNANHQFVLYVEWSRHTVAEASTAVCMYIVITLTFRIFTGMKSFTAHIHNIFYVSVEFSHSYHFETNQSVSMKEIAAEALAEIRDRTDEFLDMFDWMSFAFSFFFLTVLFK
jgi:hypothetical protein